MAHEIMNHDKVGMARTGAWHGLGTVVPDYMTPEVALREFLGWQVEAREIYMRNSLGEFVMVPDKRVTVRADVDLPLGVVSDSYEIIQNQAMLEDIKALCGESGARVATVGSVKNCKRVWVLLQMAQESLICGDTFNEYIALMSSHDGTGGYVIAPTSVRIVCNNTYSCAFGASEGKAHAITIRHTSGARDAIAQARDIVGKMRTSFADFRDVLTSLGGNNITDTAARYLLKHILPGESTVSENKRADVLASFRSPRGGSTAAVKNTALGLFNAVTEYVDYRASVRANGRNASTVRAENSVMGTGSRLRHDALSVIQEAMANKELAAVMADDSAQPSLVENMLQAAVN